MDELQVAINEGDLEAFVTFVDQNPDEIDNAFLNSILARGTDAMIDHLLVQPTTQLTIDNVTYMGRLDQKWVMKLTSHRTLDQSAHDTRWSWAAIHFVVRFGGPLKALQDYMARPDVDVNLLTKKGHSPFMLAAYAPNSDSLDALLACPKTDITSFINQLLHRGVHFRSWPDDRVIKIFKSRQVPPNWKYAKYMDATTLSLYFRAGCVNHKDAAKILALNIIRRQVSCLEVVLAYYSLHNPYLLDIMPQTWILDRDRAEGHFCIKWKVAGYRAAVLLRMIDRTQGFKNRFFSIASRLPCELRHRLANLVYGCDRDFVSERFSRLASLID